MRFPSLGLACGAVLVALTSGARAQSCHAGSPWPASATTLRASVGGSFGAYDNAVGSGNYQGVSASLGAKHPWLSLQLTLPLYRLVYGTQTVHGPGDLGVDGRATVYRSSGDEVALGAMVGAMIPTGDKDKSLGMGHVMLMPGAWAELRSGRWSSALELSFTGAIGASGGHDHGGLSAQGPLVDPMNRYEVGHSARLSYEALTDLQVFGRLLGAVPAWTAEGQAREMVGAGVQAVVQMFDASAEVQVPIVGDPFTARLLLFVGVHG